MLNRAPAPPYGFATTLALGSVYLTVFTPDFPLETLDHPDHHTGGDGLIQPAIDLGLHLVDERLQPPAPNPDQPWMFQLPTKARPATIIGPNVKITAAQCATINEHWWARAVMRGGTCRFITTTGLLAGAVSRVHPEVIRAHGGHRLVGATIPIEF